QRRRSPLAAVPVGAEGLRAVHARVAHARRDLRRRGRRPRRRDGHGAVTVSRTVEIPTVAPGRLRRRTGPKLAAALAAAGALAAIATVAVVNPLGRSGNSGAAGIDNGSPTGLAVVARRPLSSQTMVSATLGYADPSTISVAAGTAPSAVLQARQAVATAQDQLGSAQATQVADAKALADAPATLAADAAKQAVDCRRHHPA